jgi:hypothetical protein
MKRIALTMCLALQVAVSNPARSAPVAEDNSHSIVVPDASWEGTYTVSSLLCTSPEDGSNCSKIFSDSLQIRKKGNDYQVTLESTQANQHVCAFSFQMKVTGWSLVHETAYGRILVTRKKAGLTIISDNVDPTALGLGICGAHADINGLVFPRVSKRHGG